MNPRNGINLTGKNINLKAGYRFNAGDGMGGTVATTMGNLNLGGREISIDSYNNTEFKFTVLYQALEYLVNATSGGMALGKEDINIADYVKFSEDNLEALIKLARKANQLWAKRKDIVKQKEEEAARLAAKAAAEAEAEKQRQAVEARAAEAAGVTKDAANAAEGYADEADANADAAAQYRQNAEKSDISAEEATAEALKACEAAETAKANAQDADNQVDIARTAAEEAAALADIEDTAAPFAADAAAWLVDAETAATRAHASADRAGKEAGLAVQAADTKTKEKSEVNFSWPITDKCQLTSVFGIYKYYNKKQGLDVQKPHDAIDLGAPVGTPVISIAEGKVLEAGNKDDGYGNYVLVEHANGYKSKYSHLRDLPSVKKGDVVAQSAQVGVVGNTTSTGASTDYHLDLEITNEDGKKIDPLSVLGALPSWITPVIEKGFLEVNDNGGYRNSLE
jgi:murein DD-endopeptidase MepM/ murein hydrolase activator NlpD